jgi:CarboxypepD_reg-like domain
MNTKVKITNYGLLLSVALIAACSGGGGSSSSTPSVEKATVSGAVSDVERAGLMGVTVQVVGSSTQASTDDRGHFNLSVETGKSTTLKLSKAGFAEQYKVLDVPIGRKEALVDARMVSREPAQSVTNVENGFSVTSKNGAKVTLPANAVVNSAGQAVTGDIQISVTPVDVKSAEIDAFPGLFEGVDQAGTRSAIGTFGTVEIVMSQNGNALQIAPGKTAEIEIPQYVLNNFDGSSVALGQKIALWFLDETTGVWQQEGQGDVVASASASGLALRGTVSHFSWHSENELIATSGGALVRCLGVPGQFSVISECRVGGVLLSPAPLIQDTTLVPVGESRTFKVVGSEDVKLRACAMVQTTSGETGPACGTTVINVPSGTSRNADVQLNLDIPWVGAARGDLNDVNVRATLRILGSTISGTAQAFGVTWGVNGAINQNLGELSLGLADGGTASADFFGIVDVRIAFTITGNWAATSGLSVGKKGRFVLHADL